MFEYCAAPIKGNNKNASKTRILLNNQIVSGEMSFGETKHELIAVICDSIGASPRSEIASEIAVRGFMNFDIASASPLKVMKRLKEINDAILLTQEDNQSNIAATIAGIILFENCYLAFNLGDVKILHHVDDSLHLKSKDHNTDNLIFEASHRDIIDGRHTLAGYLGNKCGNFPSVKRGFLDDESDIILCSNSIYKTVTDHFLLDIMNRDQTIKEKGRAIIDASHFNDSMDDMSLVLIRKTA